jgi:Tol biopolymer transport system component
VWPYGFTADGTFVHGLEPVGFASYETTVDAAAARVFDSPRRIADHPLDANTSPAWSPDGRWLAYVSNRPGNPTTDGGDVAGLVTIRRADGTGGRQFPIHSMSHQTRVRWWPDGGSVLLLSGERRDRETGSVIERLFEARNLLTFEIDANGHRVYYLIASSPNPQIRVLDLEGRADRLAYTGPIFAPSGFSLSPDGRILAVVARTRAAGIHIRTVVTSTSEEKEELSLAERPILGPFTPDGRFLLFSRALDTDSTRSQVVVLDRQSGDARPLDIIDEQIWQMQLHADGRRLAFVAGAPGQRLFAMRGDLVR